jgi:hypothetical protein
VVSARWGQGAIVGCGERPRIEVDRTGYECEVSPQTHGRCDGARCACGARKINGLGLRRHATFGR